MTIRCRICGKIYETKPDSCELDGLSDFEEISEKEAAIFIVLGDGETFKEFSVNEFPVDLCHIDPEQKFNFTFSPKGLNYKIRLPLKVIFGKESLTINKTAEENTFQLTILKSIIKTELKKKESGSGVIQKIVLEKDAESKTISIGFHLNNEIFLNGLTLKLFKE